MDFKVCHKSLDILHLGTEKARSYYIPYATIDEALTFERRNSSYYIDLCGEWKFRFYSSFEDVDTDSVALADYMSFDDITVPRSWQMYTERSYDKPMYSNLQYPFHTDPPHVPDENPCGAYYTDFEVSPDINGKKLLLNFEGVSSCFYLWVNGEFRGYSQVSHCTSEFDITESVHEGTNTLCVLVVKWCDGTYLEDQDFFRLSGIFRDVYILLRSECRIADFTVRTKLLGENKAAVDVEYLLCGGDESIFYGFSAPNGRVLSHGEVDGGSFSVELDSPLLWNDEKPHLYYLFITVGDEIIPVYVGIRDIRIEDGRFLVNGKPVKLKGVNRHDSNPDNGYAVSLDDMTSDLMLMKRANVNAIRTSHYPNSPLFTELCDMLGFYVIDEADIETHGMGYEVEGEWDWQRWSLLSRLPEWKQSYVDRAERLYERDKNRACVVMWSLGNESGVGENHRAMAQFIRSRDNKAIIHYENSHLEFKAVEPGADYCDISDVESRMYANVEYIENYLNNPEYKKPFFMCEYVCSMSTGDVYDYWRLVDEYDNFCGGCIWEFCDHAVNVPDADGKPRYYYGGDFGDKPNDGICCLDGLVYPDRKPRPGYYDMKKVYEPFRGSFDGKGTLTVRNVRYFTSLCDLSALWTLSCGNDEIISGELETLEIEPQSEKEYNLLNIDDYRGRLSENCFLTIRFVQRNNTPWAEKGYEVGFLQYEIPTRKESTAITSSDRIEFSENNRYLNLKAGETALVFDKSYGRIEKYSIGETELLAQGSRFDIWKAPNYNGGSKNRWYLERFDRITQKTYSTKVISASDTQVKLEVLFALGAHSCPPVIRGTAEYCFNNDGSLTVSVKGNVRENAPYLPRLGLQLTMDGSFEILDYFGLGATETYPDRYKSARFGEYKLTVTDNFEHYIRPQENSSRYKTRWVKIKNTEGVGLYAEGFGIGDFSFSASHYTANDLISAAHDFELVKRNETYVNLDWRVNAISEDSILSNENNKRLLKEKSFEFGFKLKAIRE